MSRPQVFEIFTICGWIRVDMDSYSRHRGPKRWKFEDEERWHGYGIYDDEDE